ncbi:lipopolysaccharide kinase InaA family protein [Maricurvus nonylphenolicus]|uniref:lipopolysaccharide kinase InaA family protein n=1 Tax=Maricurvus nonylphenolicus TaxID=1008307 RepID=UPI0036F39EF2
MSEWTILPTYQQGRTAKDFASLEDAFSCGGELVTQSSLCTVSRLCYDGEEYYIKRYLGPAEGAARFFGKSKAKREWENLSRFSQWGLSPAELVAYGEESRWYKRRGVVITRGVKNAVDMAALAREKSPLLKNDHWVRSVCRQVAHATQVMHQNCFGHNDWKWRNILINGPEDDPRVHMIDCPAGTFWSEPFLSYRKIKDLACLDREARPVLTRSQRLYFYKQYTGRDKLSAKDKRIIRKVIQFYKGRKSDA